LLRIATLSLHLACAHLARLRCQFYTSKRWEQKLSLTNPYSHALLADKFNCTPCRNYLVHLEKQLKLIHSSSQTSVSKHEITCTTYKSKCITERKYS
jgi:hypothetical protein